MSRQVRTRKSTTTDALAEAATHFEAAERALKNIKLNHLPITLRDPVREARTYASDGSNAVYAAILADATALGDLATRRQSRRDGAR